MRTDGVMLYWNHGNRSGSRLALQTCFQNTQVAEALRQNFLI